MARRSRKRSYAGPDPVRRDPEQELPSRTARKKAVERLQQLGEALVAARPGLLDSLPLPETLREAILEARTIASFGAKRRQLQYIGKLMRGLDDETVDAIRNALGEPYLRPTATP